MLLGFQLSGGMLTVDVKSRWDIQRVLEELERLSKRLHVDLFNPLVCIFFFLSILAYCLVLFHVHGHVNVQFASRTIDFCSFGCHSLHT